MVKDLVIVKETKTSEYEKLIDALSSQYSNAKGRKDTYWRNRFRDTSFGLIAVLMLSDDRRVVGIIGCVEMIEGVCGLSVWWVENSYRKSSLTLLSTCLSTLGSTPVINSSANPRASLIFGRMKGWKKSREYIGIPKKLFGIDFETRVEERTRLNILLNSQSSMLGLLYNTFRHRKLSLMLSMDKENLLIYKEIVVFSKNFELNQSCISHYGDRYC